MNEQQNITVIPAIKRTAENNGLLHRQRVAAYCRVSTDQEEQKNSYHVQIAYYTEYINSNPEWTLVTIFADEGLSGTQMKKRTQFNRMMRMCRQKKIDLILCKSISRFARNTVDCLECIRKLKELGIGVIFEKENLNTLTMTSEFMIALYGSFAQAESESISKNVAWGFEKSFKDGKVKYNMSRTLGYRKEKGKPPEIIPEEAEIVREIFRLYLEGLSPKRIADHLKEHGVKRREGDTEWAGSTINVILHNEKYAGDALLQKYYTPDCITHRKLKNRGEKTRYLVQDCHEAIIDRETYNRVQQELARRSSVRKRSDKGRSEQGKYCSLYALTDIMVCGECGTPYRRVTWNSHGKKLIVWRCISRLDHGSRYCHNSPSINEEKLHRAIINAINGFYEIRQPYMDIIEHNIETVMTGDDENADEKARINERLDEIDNARNKLIGMITDGSVQEDSLDEEFEKLFNEEQVLMDRLKEINGRSVDSAEIRYALQTAEQELNRIGSLLTEYDDGLVRKLIECIKVISKTDIQVIFKVGYEVTVEVEK